MGAGSSLVTPCDDTFWSKPGVLLTAIPRGHDFAFKRELLRQDLHERRLHPNMVTNGYRVVDTSGEASMEGETEGETTTLEFHKQRVKTLRLIFVTASTNSIIVVLSTKLTVHPKTTHEHLGASVPRDTKSMLILLNEESILERITFTLAPTSLAAVHAAIADT